jgi:hypothetical protein
VQILAGVSSGAKLAQYLVVAGGGGGGGNQGDGGGGAGGVRCTKDATGGGGSLETPFAVSFSRRNLHYYGWRRWGRRYDSTTSKHKRFNEFCCW